MIDFNVLPLSDFAEFDENAATKKMNEDIKLTVDKRIEMLENLYRHSGISGHMLFIT
jgi:hypothetical protein